MNITASSLGVLTTKTCEQATHENVDWKNWRGLGRSLRAFLIHAGFMVTLPQCQGERTPGLEGRRARRGCWSDFEIPWQ